MAKGLLLEIGLEEVPARFLRSAVQQLGDKVTKWLNEAQIDYDGVTLYATPRRMAVYVQEVAEKQKDIHEEVKGPSRKIAKDDHGEWSKAALGFAKSQGCTAEDLYFKELNGVEYIYAAKSRIGVLTEEIVGTGLEQLILSMNFPKSMRWGTEEMKFIRPIRWIVALFGDQIIPLTVAGVTAGRTTRGHRFLGNDVDIASPDMYESVLLTQFVYANFEKREALLVSQLNQLAEQKGWTISIKEDLLEEVIFLVEYPTVLFGTFNPEFIEIPQEVLITSMREHQRYFPVFDQSGGLLPYFVTVRNGNDVSLDQVARGNEKVLRARLSDARFFYQEDQKMSIESALTRLETIVFHEELGTVGDKVRRITAISNAIAIALRMDVEAKKKVERTAAICKFDLVSLMVYEFPELQGIMGEDYARKAGEAESVAKAILEHYKPKFSGDTSPSELIGAVVSIADKLDTIVGCFSIGIIPTGSQDPYALRRQAAGIVQILQDSRIFCTIAELFTIALVVHNQVGLLKRDQTEIRNELYEFFALRVKNVLIEQQTRYDIMDAVIASGFDDVSSMIRRATALSNLIHTPDFKETLESFNRVINIAVKASTSSVNADLFTEPAEGKLFASWKITHERFIGDMSISDEVAALHTLTLLKQPITAFFEAVMVMAEDEAVRHNRLALLLNISNDFKQFADFTRLIG